MENGYKKIISFKVWHEYYTQLLCNDLIFEPTDTCRQLLSGYNLIIKKTDSGFEILQAISSDQPFIEIDELSKFHFAIHVKNSYFFNFTQNPVTDNDQLIFLSNSDYTSQQFNPFPVDYSKFENVDFVKQYICDNDVLCETLDIHNLRYNKSNIGFLEICYNQVTPNNNDLHAVFETKEFKWKYTVIAPKTNELPTFSIKDSGMHQPGNRYSDKSYEFKMIDSMILENKIYTTFESSKTKDGSFILEDKSGNPISITKPIIDASIVKKSQFQETCFWQNDNKLIDISEDTLKNPGCKTDKSRNSFRIAEDGTIILTGNKYGNISIPENSKVIFEQNNVCLKTLIIKDNTSVHFNKAFTELKIQNVLEVKNNCTFNPEDKFALCYVGYMNTHSGENTVKFIECALVNVTIFTFGKITIHAAQSNKLKLNGLFIAQAIENNNQAKITLGKHYNIEFEDEFIPLYEEGKKGLQLMYNSGYDVTTVISDNLPNPGIKNTNTEIYINI